MKPKNIPIKDWRQLILYLFFFFEQGGNPTRLLFSLLSL
jgi:hypothetical protein